MAMLLAYRQGCFVFERVAEDRLLGDHALSIQQIIAQAGLRESEIQQYHHDLPDPATVFGLAQQRPARG